MILFQNLVSLFLFHENNIIGYEHYDTGVGNDLEFKKAKTNPINS